MEWVFERIDQTIYFLEYYMSHKACHVSINDVFVPSAEMMKCAINLVAKINTHVFQENA